MRRASSGSTFGALVGRWTRIAFLVVIAVMISASTGLVTLAERSVQLSDGQDAFQPGASGSPSSAIIASDLAAMLRSARRFVVFHGIEPGHPSQTWSYTNSYVWGDIGIGPLVKTNYSGGSTLIGDCYQQPGQVSSKGCADIEPHGDSPLHVPPTYIDYNQDLAPVVQDLRHAVGYVDSLAATRTIAGNLGSRTTPAITSQGCGSVNVIRVTGNVSPPFTITGCPTDYFIFDVDGQWSASGDNQVAVTGGVTGANILWVYKGRLQNSGGAGWAGTAIFATADGADNKVSQLRCFDCALFVLNGKLSMSGNRIRWNPFTFYDYGDAPNRYQTLYSATNGAARHKSTMDWTSNATSPHLGVNWDAETNGQPNTVFNLIDPATGDDIAGTPDDEDGLTVPVEVIASSNSLLLPVTVINTSGLPATVACWIDFNANDRFSDAGERAESTVLSQADAQTMRLVFFQVSGYGTKFMRCRISTDPDAVDVPVSPIPPAAPVPVAGNPSLPLQKSSFLLNDGWPDGEVEDYQVTIVSGDAGMDFGDAPDEWPGTATGNYNTTQFDHGPLHLIVPGGVFLGTAEPDLEFGTLQNTAADADDLDALPDEDGIQVLPVITTQSTSVDLNVTATNNTGTAGRLRCWIDFNRDGVFTGAGEPGGPTMVAANSGTVAYPLTFTGFSNPVAGASYIRCRVAYAAGEVARPVDTAYSGEVEDFLITIQN